MKLREVGGRIRASARYVAQFRRFARQQEAEGSSFPRLAWRDRFIRLGDATRSTEFDRHYVYHTAWAARVIARGGDGPHHDFGSLLYFATLVSAFRPVRFYDYRPAGIALEGLESRRADLTAIALPSNSLGSVSCMHVLEHVGLGRYGDPLDAGGDVKAARELQRVVAPGGDLLVVVPVGRPRVCFNAHRVYSYELLLERFAGMRLLEFSMAPDPGKGPPFVENADPASVAGQDYACGCFWFRKPAGAAGGEP